MKTKRAFDHSKYQLWIDPNEVVPYEKNAKIHTDKQVKNIVNSIKRFGWQQDTVLTKDNVLVIGHGRRLAALEIGCEMPYHVIDKNADELTDEDIRELRIADNQTNAETGFDFSALAEDIDGLDFEGFDFDFGIDTEEQDEEPIEIVEDEPPTETETRCKVGDLWQMGEHRLICGDSTDTAVIDRLMDGVKADMVFTDPPYGMNLNTDYSDMKSDIFKGGIGGKKYEQGKVDEFHPEMIDAVFTIDADEMFLWGADYFAELLPNKNDGSWIVWDKRANGNDDVAEDYSSDKMYGSCFELCWSKKKHKRDIARVKWAGIFGISSQDQNKRFHPTQKPLELCAWFLNRYSKEGQVVVDLFGGSGSTLIACEQLNRKCYMAELDERYVSVIVNRWLKFTGRKDEIFCIRDGQKLTYDEVFKQDRSKDL